MSKTVEHFKEEYISDMLRMREAIDATIKAVEQTDTHLEFMMTISNSPLVQHMQKSVTLRGEDLKKRFDNAR